MRPLPTHRPLRIGAVSFTNTLPLIEGLAGPGLPPISLSLAPPAELADQLAAGDLDVGLIPVVEHLRAGDRYRLLGDAVIGSVGPVDSVIIYARKPWAEVRTLAADRRSRTSVALAQVLAARMPGRADPRLEVTARFDPVRGDDGSADAVLVIGDANWTFPQRGWAEVLDLGAAWTDLTGLGFVYAGWSARADMAPADAAGLVRRLADARDRGVADALRLARGAAARGGVPVARVERYLTQCLQFRLDEPLRRGMDLFCRWCGEQGLLSSAAAPPMMTAPPRPAPQLATA